MENINATGNRKCWRIVNSAVVGRFAGILFTAKQAKQLVANAHNNGDTDAQYVRDGFKLIACQGDAHFNAHIDNCSQCAPRWGFVMVPEGK